MKFSKINIDEFINKWINFREEELSYLTTEDKKHLIEFDDHTSKILKNVSDINKAFVTNELTELDNEFADYVTYWNRKYYENGFKDAFRIMLFGISDN